jgi:hypothetical protein
MKKKSFFVYVLSMYLALTPLSQAETDIKPKHISIAVLAVNQQSMSLFSEQFNTFNNSQSEIKVEVDFYSDQGHKSKLSSWLESGEYDLIHWQAGKRLDDIVGQQLLLPIHTLIEKKY